MIQKKEIKIVSQIIQELSLFLMFHGYTHYGLHFERHHGHETFTVTLHEKNEAMLDTMKEKISRAREQEIEAYYWELLGDMDSSSELDIMGLLIDEIDILESENIITIILKREIKP